MRCGETANVEKEGCFEHENGQSKKRTENNSEIDK